MMKGCVGNNDNAKGGSDKRWSYDKLMMRLEGHSSLTMLTLYVFIHVLIEL